ncbi:MAG: 3',5'-cyclic-nucleotide phosphodiesterase, partial [uncultured Rubrobacteraceae bacterium]
GQRRAFDDLPDQRHPLWQRLFYPGPPGAVHSGDQRHGPDRRRGLGGSDGRGLQAGVRAVGRVREPVPVREPDGNPGQPRLEERRLHPLRAAVRRALLGDRVRRGDHGRGRLLGARPERRARRARALRLREGLLQERRGQAQDLRGPPSPRPDPGDGPRAEHHLRRGRRPGAPERPRGGPRPLWTQARPVLLAPGEHVYSERRHGLDDASAGEHPPELQHHRDRRPPREGLPQVPVQGARARRGLRRRDAPVLPLRGQDRRAGSGPLRDTRPGHGRGV